MANNPFQDSKIFMKAVGQTIYEYNEEQLKLYFDLINEEWNELHEAAENNDKVEMLDALVDLLVVVTGAIHSMGVDSQDAWDEVMRTNFAKIDPTTGKVRRREDGKVLKPEGWQPPNMAKFL